MIRWIREKFKGNIVKKHRKLYRQLQDINTQEKKLFRRKKRVAAQLALIGALNKIVEGNNPNGSTDQSK